MKPFLSSLAFLFFISICWGQNMVPQIQNLSYSLDQANQRIQLTFDLVDAENDEVDVQLFLSLNNGITYEQQITQAMGDVGFPVLPGMGKSISWEYADVTDPLSGLFFKLVASDHETISIAELVEQVDSSKLKEYLAFIQGQRHRIGDPAHLEFVKDTFEHFMTDHGIEVERLGFSYNGYAAQNMLGLKRGTTNDGPWYLIGGHFDTVIGSEGADDNGTAIAGTMEIVRILSKVGLKKSLRFIGFDLEEDGLVGSTRYIDNQIRQGASLQGFIDFEMIGYYSDRPNSMSVPAGFSLLFPGPYNEVVADANRGNFITNVGNTGSNSLRLAFDTAAARYVPDLRVISLNVPGNGLIAPDLLRSDHAPFWLDGKAALMLTDGANFRNPNYHQPTDVLDSLDFTFMRRVVQASLATLAELCEPHHASFVTLEVNLPSGVKAIDPTLVRIYPLPASDHLVLQGTPSTAFESWELVDTKGLLRANGPVFNQEYQRISLEGCEPGLYLLRLTGPQGFLVKKVLVGKYD